MHGSGRMEHESSGRDGRCPRHIVTGVDSRMPGSLDDRDETVLVMIMRIAGASRGETDPHDVEALFLGIAVEDMRLGAVEAFVPYNVVQLHDDEVIPFGGESGRHEQRQRGDEIANL